MILCKQALRKRKILTNSRKVHFDRILRKKNIYLEYLVDSHLQVSCNLDSWRRTASCICHNCRRSRSTARWRHPSNLRKETCLVYADLHANVSRSRRMYECCGHRPWHNHKIKNFIRIARNYVHKAEQTARKFRCRSKYLLFIVTFISKSRTISWAINASRRDAMRLERSSLRVLCCFW